MTTIYASDTVVTEDHLVLSDTPGIELHVRNKRPAGMRDYAAETTLVVIHGATFSSGSLYDVPVGGRSFLDALALAGHDVFAVDVRGYGGSTLPPEMEREDAAGVPSVGTDVGVRDLTTAIDWVLEHRGIDRTDLFGMSWGGTVAGAFAAANPDKLRRLVLLAPQWVDDKPIPMDPGGPIDAYRLVPVRDFLTRWLGTVPPAYRDALIPEGWFEAWATATLAEEPWSDGRAPGRLRAANGPIQDIRDYWAVGRPYYDPADIAVPVLLIHGEWDHDVPIDVTLQLFLALRPPYKRWVEIGEATHMLLLEKHRQTAIDAIVAFLREADQEASTTRPVSL